MCEGDDYWTDPLKLQKQVDFLEANRDYIMCYHNAKIVNENGDIIKASKLPDNLKKDFSRKELIQGRMILTLTICFRNVLKEFPDELSKVHNGDKFLTSLLGNMGKGKYMADITDAVYRKHSGAIWSKLDEVSQIFHNGVTRAWLYRYYKRIGLNQYADSFRKEVVEHFARTLKEIAATDGRQHENFIHDIFTKYADVIDRASEHQLCKILRTSQRPISMDSKAPIVSTEKLPEKNDSKKNNLLHNTGDIVQLTPCIDITDTLSLNWVLTRKCNFQCSYCTVKDNKNGFFPGINQLKSAIDKLLLVKKKYLKFIITGGEPTIHPHYLDFLKYLFDKLNERAEVATITNLSPPVSFFEKTQKMLLEYLSQVSFLASFHFEFADKERFIQNVRYLAQNGITVTIQILAHPDHMDTVKEVYDDLNDINSNKLKVDIKIVRHQFGSNPDPRYTNQDLEWLKSFYSESDNKPLDVEFLKQDQSIAKVKTSVNELIANNLNKFKGFECHAGLESISVNANGDIDRAVCFRGTNYKKSNIFTDEDPSSVFKNTFFALLKNAGV